MRNLLVILSLIFYASFTQAQWQLNGVAVCDTTGYQHIAANGILSDGAGGAFVVWGDNRDGWDIYAQHVDSSGRMLWDNQGKAICSYPGWQFAPRVAPDGEGGFVAAWHDTRNDARDVYAQRVDKNGNILWAEEGVQVVHYEQFQGVEDILRATDSTFIIVWRDDRFFPDSASIHIQKITKDGIKLWQEDGVRVSNDPGSPKLVSDEQGGAFVIWAAGDIKGILVQHINKIGNRLWGMPGKFASLDNAFWIDTNFSVSSDGYSGCYIAWDYSKTDHSYIQRVDSLGNRLWGDNGIQIGKTNNQQRKPLINLIEINQVFVIWRDSPYTLYNIFDENGQNFFSEPGKKLNNYWTGLDFDVVTDITRNILVSNFEITAEQPNKYKINAHKLNEYFESVWDSSGKKITDINISPNEVRGFSVSDGTGGIITAWDDDRKDNVETDIYIQRVYSNGKVGGDTTTSMKHIEDILPQNFDLKVYPNPFNNTVNIEFFLKNNTELQFTIFDITGRKIWIKKNEYYHTGRHKLSWTGHNYNGKEAATGVYFISVSGKGLKVLRKVLLIK